MGNSVPVFDHIGLWCHDLGKSAERFETLLNAHVEPGGRHDGQGTWNRLVGAKDDVYLELIARDPDQNQAGPIIRSVGNQSDLTTCLVAYRTSDLEGTHKRAIEAGAASLGIQSMSRAGADGQKISWRLLFIQHPDHPVLPFFIDWQSTPHPSTRLNPVLDIAPPVFRTPTPDSLQGLLKHLGVAAQSVYGEDHEILISLRNGTNSASASRLRSLDVDEVEPRDNQNQP